MGGPRRGPPRDGARGDAATAPDGGDAMRLTLRTLLSWKDGMLAPDVAGDFATRVEASPAARDLAARIDEVVGRPTLAAPPPDASGFAAAANTTAEYLDNVLALEQLGEFERVCFVSDAQLAETAAAHEILAGIAREPLAPLDAATRRRLLAAVKARQAGDVPATAGAPVSASPPAAAPRPLAARSSRDERPPVHAWLLFGGSILLLVALVAVLRWSLSNGPRLHDAAPAAGLDRRPAMPPVADAVPPAAPAVAAADGGPASAPEPAIDAPAPASEPAPPVAIEQRHAQSAAVPEERPPTIVPSVPRTAAPAEAPATDPVAAVGVGPAPAAVEQRVPQGDALAIAAPPAGTTPPPPQAGPAAGPAAPAAGATVAAGDALLSRSAIDRPNAWLAGAEATALALPVDIAVPPMCRSTVVIDGLRITLEPGTLAVLGRDAAGLPHLEVVFGAALVAGTGRVGVTAAELAGAITAGLAAPVGVEVRFVRSPGAAADAAGRVARIIPGAAPCAWQAVAPPGVAGDIPVGQALEWESVAPDTATIRTAEPAPDWLTGRPDDDAVARRAAVALTRRLAAGTAAVPALRELAADRRVENRVAAAAALALVGEFDELARLLVAEDGEALAATHWERLDAVAVQPALARGTRAAEEFAKAVVAHAPAGAGPTVVRFARGFTDDDLAGGAAAELVAALDSPHLAVRRYAIGNLLAIVDPKPVDRQRYRAEREAEARRDGVAWWRKRLEQGRIRRAGTAPTDGPSPAPDDAPAPAASPP